MTCNDDGPSASYMHHGQSDGQSDEMLKVVGASTNER